MGVEAANESSDLPYPSDDTRVNRRYLFYALQSEVPHWLGKRVGGGQPNISQGIIKETEIPLPYADDPARSLLEQKRIADILDKADAIRRKRKQALAHADEFLKSTFLDMFGKWLEEPIAEMPRLGDPGMAEVVSGVTKGRRFNGKETVVVPYIRVANVQDGFLDLSEIKTIEVLPSDVENLCLQHGDVLMTEGGDFDKLGRGAMWETSISELHSPEPCLQDQVQS